jgi:hypothetical protein
LGDYILKPRRKATQKIVCVFLSPATLRNLLSKQIYTKEQNKSFLSPISEACDRQNSQIDPQKPQKQQLELLLAL